jgi:sugar phosphate isomerase/epimerase
MTQPRLACCNFIRDPVRLADFARAHGFDGVEWSFHRRDIPRGPRAEAHLREAIACLAPLEVRYHCAFRNTDLGDTDPAGAERAMDVLRGVCEFIARLGGSVVTVHVGLGRESTIDLSWERTLAGLTELVSHARCLGVRICLENLGWGWTSRPALFEKLLRKAQPWATLDVGHAHISPSVRSQHYDLEDFVAPHPARVLNAHVYHEEDGRGHIAPRRLEEIRGRLELLRRLPHCNWWVLELREEAALLQTLTIVRAFLAETGEEEEPCQGE